MRTLVITNMYPPHHYGGYELSCRDVVDRWRSSGDDVTVLTTTMRVAGVDAPDPAFVRRELGMYWDDHVLTSPPVWRRLLHERRNLRVLARACDEVQPDVVSVWNMGAMSLGLLDWLASHGLAVAYVVCDDWLVYGPRLDAWARLFNRRRVAGRAITAVTGVPTVLTDLGATGTFLFISDTTRARAAAHWTFSRSAVVYNGIDHRDFPVVAPTDRLWSGHLLYVGRIDPRKGIATVISALVALPGARLTIDGGGDSAHRHELQELAEELDVSHRITWQVSTRAELRGLYGSADVVVFPSVWTEPFGLVPIEAMACATPVIATGVGGSGEFLHDGVNALLYPPGDAAALAAAVSRLASDPELRRSLVSAGSATASDLNVDRYADVLTAWHRATAAHFVDGEPPARVLAV